MGETYQSKWFILNYTLFRDNTQIFMSYYDNDGYYSNDNLTMEYLDTIDFRCIL